MKSNDAMPSSATTIAEFQQLIREMYLEKDVARGIDGTFMWLMEEVGELAAALRSGTQEERLRGIRRRAGVAGHHRQRGGRRSGRSRRDRKYGSGCPGCGKFICTCADAEKP